MYEELVKRLRELHPEEFGNAWDFAFACQQAMHEAADAIEELSMKLHGDEAAIAGMNREIERMVVSGNKPRWIPVEKRRAELPCICCDANGNMPFIPKGIVTIKDDQGLWQIDAGLADPSLHQSRLKPVLGYQNRITYWMPIPQPPKEDGRMEKEAGQDAGDGP